jgi:prepilin-type N-terminal cleavage/methylation domain-containing protein
MGSRRRAFSLLEVLVALAILTFGLLGLLALLQRTLQASEPIEFETRAALLADSILEGIRSHPEGGFPFVPGLNPTTWPLLLDQNPYPLRDSILQDEKGNVFNMKENRPANQRGMRLPLAFGIPGNSLDDDALVDPKRWKDENKFERATGGFTPGSDGIDDDLYGYILPLLAVDAQGRTVPLQVRGLKDLDGAIESDVSRLYLDPSATFNNLDDEGDGLIDDTGDSSIAGQDPSFYAQLFGLSSGDRLGYRPDGDFAYDPQRGLEEELSDGLDNDNDGLVDEDTALASVRRASSLASPGDPPLPNSPYDYAPLAAGNNLDDDADGEDGSPIDSATNRKVADGLDNNNDGKIDEGIDEEIWDGLDNDGDGLIDEDCQGAYLPWQPMPLPYPNEEYSFRIKVTRVQLGGDGVDDDGDAADVTRGSQLPWLVEFPTNDGLDNDGDGLTDENGILIDEEFPDGVDNDSDGLTDEDLAAYPAPRARLITVFIYQGDDRQDNDGDGWIDEEAADGIDNDGDTKFDEDAYRRVYTTSAMVELPE